MNPFETTPGYSPRNAFILALFSQAAYAGPCTLGAGRRFPCVITEGEDWRVIAFRGSANPMDFLVDAEILRTPDRVGGVQFSVHRGFHAAWEAFDDAVITYLLRAPTKQTYVTGHSAGGALATLCAGRAFPLVTSVYTFGEPRGGDAPYAAYCDAEFLHYRIEHRLDLVPRLPLPFAGYRHSGQLILVDNYSTVIAPSIWRVGWRDLIAAWHSYRQDFAPEIVLDLFRDHRLATYLRALHGFSAPPHIWAWINTTFPDCHLGETGDLTKV